MGDITIFDAATGETIEAATPSPEQEAMHLWRGINDERDRRVQEGVAVTIAGYGTVSLQGREIDMRNLHGLATAAQLRIAGGAGATLTPFRDKSNVIHQLTQPQILDLWSQGAAFVSAVFQSAWALKDSPPIPANFADDEFWP